MAFDLKKAAGFDKIVSNLDTMEITQIPIDQIDTNEKNFFSVEDVEELKDSIAMKGILQPLLVTKAGDRYRIIAGHRRHKAAAMAAAEGNDNLLSVPCVVLPEMSEAMEWALLIQTNTTTRELSYPEKMKAAQQMKSTLVQLKEEGVKITGKLRDIVAEQLEISSTELARMNVIEKNLSPKWKKRLEENNIGPAVAYELARLPLTMQDEFYTEHRSKSEYFGTKDIEDFSERAALKEYLTDDCPLASDWSAQRLREKGKKVPCQYFKKIRTRKSKKNPDECPGCCGKCPNWNNCTQCCPIASGHFERQIAAEKSKDLTQRKQELFANSALSQISERFAAAMNAKQYTVEALAAACAKLDAQLLSEQGYGSALTPWYFDKILASNVRSSLPTWVTNLDTVCQALDVTPNHLLGYYDALMQSPSFTGWNDMRDFVPPDGSRVIAIREHNGSRFTGEYIYREKTWFSADIPDMELNINNVTHWIIAPERM